MGFTFSVKMVMGRWSIEGGRKVVGRWLKVVGRWFWVHKIVFTGGLPPPRSPAVPGVLLAPQNPWRGAYSPPCPLHIERLCLSGSPFFLVPRCWYRHFWGNRSLHDGGTALSAAHNRYPFFTVRTPQAGLFGKNLARRSQTVKNIE